MIIELIVNTKTISYKIFLQPNKTILYLHPLLEEWQSGRMRQS